MILSSIKNGRVMPIGSVELRSGDHVLQAAFVERLALAGFDELELNDDVRLAIDFQLQAFSEI
jgi:hypothetical protein